MAKKKNAPEVESGKVSTGETSKGGKVSTQAVDPGPHIEPPATLLSEVVAMAAEDAKAVIEGFYVVDGELYAAESEDEVRVILKTLGLNEGNPSIDPYQGALVPGERCVYRSGEQLLRGDVSQAPQYATWKAALHRSAHEVRSPEETSEKASSDGSEDPAGDDESVEKFPPSDEESPEEKA